MWTGRVDRHGNEIYDGDIVRTAIGLALVHWSGDSCSYMINLLDSEVELRELGALTDEMMEVADNILRSPDLVKKLGYRPHDPDFGENTSGSDIEEQPSGDDPDVD
jgi:hypothetical protein